LRLKLRLHPDIRRDAAKVASIRTLGKADLLDLADKLGIDVHAIVDDVVQNGRGLESIWEEQDVERHNYSTKHPAFQGTLEFDLTFELYGQRVTRKARVEYTFAPEWEYWDLKKNAPSVGWGSATFGMSILTVPEDEDEEIGEDEEADATDETDFEEDPPKPEWVAFDGVYHLGVLNRRIWDTFDNAIEEQCRVEDAERRKAAARKRRK
jgi:hypothetical protein